MDLALGRANVIHAALMSGAASDAFFQRCRKLAQYRAAAQGAAQPDPGFGSEEPEPTTKDFALRFEPVSGEADAGSPVPFGVGQGKRAAIDPKGANLSDPSCVEKEV
jgi:hypothetical protein